MSDNPPVMDYANPVHAPVPRTYLWHKFFAAMFGGAALTLVIQAATGDDPVTIILFDPVAKLLAGIIFYFDPGLRPLGLGLIVSIPIVMLPRFAIFPRLIQV